MFDGNTFSLIRFTIKSLPYLFLFFVFFGHLNHKEVKD